MGDRENCLHYYRNVYVNFAKEQTAANIVVWAAVARKYRAFFDCPSSAKCRNLNPSYPRKSVIPAKAGIHPVWGACLKSRTGVSQHPSNGRAVIHSVCAVRSWFNHFEMMSRDAGSVGLQPALSSAKAGNRVVQITRQDKAVRPLVAGAGDKPPRYAFGVMRVRSSNRKGEKEACDIACRVQCLKYRWRWGLLHHGPRFLAALEMTRRPTAI